MPVSRLKSENIEDMDVELALLKAIVELINSCETIEELRKSVSKNLKEANTQLTG